MKKYPTLFVTSLVLATLMIPITLRASSYQSDIEKYGDTSILYVSEKGKDRKIVKNDTAPLTEEKRKEQREERKKLREELRELSPDERRKRMREIQGKRQNNASTPASEPSKKLSPAEREKRKKERQAKREKLKKETVQLSPEERKAQLEAEFEGRLENASAEEKEKICERRLARCNDIARKEEKREREKLHPMCEVVQSFCSANKK